MLHSWTFCTRKLESASPCNYWHPLTISHSGTPSVSHQHSDTARLDAPSSLRNCQFRLCFLYFATALLHQVSRLRQCCPVHSCSDVKYATFEKSCFLLYSLCESEIGSCKHDSISQPHADETFASNLVMTQTTLLQYEAPCKLTHNRVWTTV